jgi:hypothetical protein
MPELTRGESLAMELLNVRQRVVAVSLLRRRPPLIPGTHGILGDEAYRLWYELVCDEIQRLAIMDQRQIQAFCDRAGVPADMATPSRVVRPSAA